MKGIVFTEFIDLVEDKFGYETVDKIIEKSDLTSKGAYTAIGTYPHAEMVKLVTNLSSEIDVPVSDLLKLYGRHLFGVLIKSYGHFISKLTNTFQLLESIQNHIHVEVFKLYPDAELPHFETTRVDDKTLIMKYTSERKMSDFAIGLIESCLEFFGEKAELHQEDLSGDGTCVLITIKKQ